MPSRGPSIANVNSIRNPRKRIISMNSWTNFRRTRLNSILRRMSASRESASETSAAARPSSFTSKPDEELIVSSGPGARERSDISVQANAGRRAGIERADASNK
eukprot:Amastigsp_a677871_58.p5 type:complete len:104 gc:universal Amastigsp_a677871_58:2036-2347(+)